MKKTSEIIGICCSIILAVILIYQMFTVDGKNNGIARIALSALLLWIFYSIYRSFIHRPKEEQCEKKESLNHSTNQNLNVTEKVKKTKRIVDELKRRTLCPCYKLHINRERCPALTDTKLGGLPYWDCIQPYPTDINGNPMMLLAQINFTNNPMGEPLPKEGLLQFFIAEDEENYSYGCDFENHTNQENFRIVYHHKIDDTITKEQIIALNLPTCEKSQSAPFYNEYALDVMQGDSAINVEVGTFDKVFNDVINDLFAESLNGKHWLHYSAYKKDFDYFIDSLTDQNNFQILGYPTFVQYDPREIKDGTTYYDTVLLQIPTIEAEKEDKNNHDNFYVIWGDCGVANFLINQEDLKRLDFSNVFYNWDCS